MKTKAFFRSRNQRKKVEMRFAHLKTHHGFERLRLSGLSGARVRRFFSIPSLLAPLAARSSSSVRFRWPRTGATRRLTAWQHGTEAASAGLESAKERDQIALLLAGHFVPRIRLKNSTVSSSVSRRPSCM